jgi:phage baseplate assembly protein W
MKTISLPFRIDGFGNIATTTDPSKIWSDRVRTVVSTYFGERVMRSNFGSFAGSMAFNEADYVSEILDSDMATAFSSWLPDITYRGAEQTLNKDGTVSLRINYEIPTIDRAAGVVYSVLI